METDLQWEQRASVADVGNWLAFGTGALLLAVGVSRRSVLGGVLAVSSTPLLYRGLTGRWPAALNDQLDGDDTRSALSGRRGIHVRESILVELPIGDVYR